MKLYTYHGKCNASGVRIREAREKLGFSQEELAGLLQLRGVEMNQKAISRIETGARVVPDYELIYFSGALKVSITWLLGEE